MSRFIREETRGHSAHAVEGLASSGGGLLTIPQPFLISNRGFEASHVYVSGGRIYDPFTRGINQISGWTESGTVPRVPAQILPGCGMNRAVEGIGQFTSGNLFNSIYNASGADALDFAGDFAGAVLLMALSNPGIGNEALVGDGGHQIAGWNAFISFNAGGAAIFGTNSAGANIWTTTANVAQIATAPSVFCFGRSGSTGLAKMNLGAIATTSALNTSRFNYPGRIGAEPSLGTAAHIVIYEIWLAQITPSDNLFTSIMNEVKGDLGITIW